MFHTLDVISDSSDHEVRIAYQEILWPTIVEKAVQTGKSEPGSPSRLGITKDAQDFGWSFRLTNCNYLVYS